MNKGAVAAGNPAEVARQCDIIITVLPNGPHVESVAEGKHGILASGNKNLLWLEMSTIDPHVTKRLRSSLEKAMPLGLLRELSTEDTRPPLDSIRKMCWAQIFTSNDLCVSSYLFVAKKTAKIEILFKRLTRV